ncbi:MAG: glycoside hydrolase family 32 protein [Verrucomicrobiae bacterium]|nr:glycoside hydrolase family 32 protein [Verrucomicrobiae bacterium]
MFKNYLKRGTGLLWVFTAMFCGGTLLFSQRADILISDFEGDDYGDWKVQGEAFGRRPAPGTLPNQMKVSGFLGKGLVNSFYNGDRSTGMLTSPEFVIQRKYINFLIGGGGFEGKTCMNLIVDGKVVREAVGPNTEPGGSEELKPAAWDVRELEGKKAVIRIVDDATGGWGHINVDHIVQSDNPTNVIPRMVAAEIDVALNKKYLLFPTKNGAPRRRVTVTVDSQTVRDFDIELSDAPDWYAHLDLTPWQDKKIKVRINRIPENSKIPSLIRQSDVIWDEKNLYKEPLRAQFHFSPKRGWNNDPNGLVYANGEYHLYFQHHPYGWSWGNMHWGHAVSKDLVHWKELPIAIYPARYGDWAWSGSAVVDKNNTSGWKRGKNELIVAAFTSTGRGECILYSNDRGRTFSEYEKNPVVKHEGRDPRLLWHEPTKQWVMAIYDELDRKQWIMFYTSPDLKSWTYQSRIEGFFECPDLFEISGKWILTAASSDYMIGSFDGKQFVPETPKLKGHRGRGFYAAQTFSNEPKGRVVQIGWLQVDTPGMPFNQAMSLPMELNLKQTREGLRMTWMPVDELKSLRDGGNKANDIQSFRAQLIELRAEFGAVEFVVNIRGAAIKYNPLKQEISVNGITAPAPLVDGKQRLIAYVDKTILEVFASDGLTYIPLPFTPKSEDQSVSISGGSPSKLEVYKLKSAWK